jgi:hypothetical protein
LGKALNIEDCLRQATEYIRLAEASSDPDLRDNYLKVAAELTLLASALDKRRNGEASRTDFEQTPTPEPAQSTERRR